MSFAFARLMCPRVSLLNSVRNAPVNSIPRLVSLQSITSRHNSGWDFVGQATNSIHQELATQQREPPTAEQIWAQNSKNFKESATRFAKPSPYKGRSVPVVDGDVARALRGLDIILNRNRVRKQLRLAERHEKKGVKRRRLQSERWRRLFAHQVRKSVQLVTKIRNRGA